MQQGPSDYSQYTFWEFIYKNFARKSYDNKWFFQTLFSHKLRKIIIKSHETTYLMPRMLEIQFIS